MSEVPLYYAPLCGALPSYGARVGSNTGFDARRDASLLARDDGAARRLAADGCAQGFLAHQKPPPTRSAQ